MSRQIFIGDKMYAIFSNATVGLYVQPCEVVEITKDGFTAECHNGGESGHGRGLEFFKNEDVGTSVFFSKDSADVVIRRENENSKY